MFTNVTDKLGELIKEGNTSTTKFKESLEKLFKAFPEFIDIKKNTKEEGVHGNKDLVHSVLNYIELQLSSVSKFGTEIWYEKESRTDIILVHNRANLGVIFEVNTKAQ